MQFLNILKQNPIYILWLWLVIINLAAFLAMGIDKYKAEHQKWRIPERRLFILAAVGGSLGGILGMYAFHHKVRHRKFAFGFPAILVIQAAIGILLYMNSK